VLHPHDGHRRLPRAPDVINDANVAATGLIEERAGRLDVPSMVAIPSDAAISQQQTPRSF
jgi:hypothetical protein